jgi:arabinogalactan oligomer/maltooligosaccharide transport system permease protein
MTATTKPAPARMTATAKAEPARRSRLRHFFVSGRQDSPFKRIMINLVLIFCCIIAVYPVLRILSVSLRPGDRLLSTSLAIIPDDATLEAYRTVLVE